MNLVLAVSILARLTALGWSLLLLQRIRDRRLGLLPVLLALLVLEQTLASVTQRGAGGLSVTGDASELAGLAVSLLALVAVA